MIAYCSFNSNFSIIKENYQIFKTRKVLKAICFLNSTTDDFNNYYFPKAISKNISNIKIYNYYKYIPFIFKHFFLFKETNKYILKTFFYKNYNKGFNLTIKINETKFFCTLYEDVILSNSEKPILKNFLCNEIINNNNPILDINKIKSNLNKCNNSNDEIPNQFIISKIYKEFINTKNYIVIKGKLFDDLTSDINNLKIFFFILKKRQNVLLKHQINLFKLIYIVILEKQLITKY